MNKIGQSIIGTIFSAGLFLFIWIFFASKIISSWGQSAVATHEITGLTAFLLLNLNLLIFFIFIAGMFGYMYMGSTR